MEKNKKISLVNIPGTLLFKGCVIFYLKKIVKAILNIQRGPDVVFKSLIRGLNDLSASYNINPSLDKMSENVHVISSVAALNWAIKQKHLGKINKLIAGPNISTLPYYNGAVLCDPAIDIILVPSEWVKEVYSKSRPEISSKIRVWPAGVKVPEITAKPLRPLSERKSLVFRKSIDDVSFNKITEELKNRKILFKVISYGSFKQEEYFDLLKDSDGLIYLQEVESQGLALQEAWARSVPTLVWNKGHFTYPTGERIDGNIVAPFLTPETGMFFKNAENFPSAFDEFQSKLHSFTPRDYVIKNLSDKVCAENYLKIINE